MANVDFFIKEGDRNPPLEAIVIDANGDPIDLSTATAIRFFMINPGETTPKVDGSAMTKVTPPGTDGRVRYEWGVDDTDAYGDYDGEIEVEWSNNTKTTFPNHGFIRIKVLKTIQTTD